AQNTQRGCVVLLGRKRTKGALSTLGSLPSSGGKLLPEVEAQAVPLCRLYVNSHCAPTSSSQNSHRPLVLSTTAQGFQWEASGGTKGNGAVADHWPLVRVRKLI